MTEIKPIEQSFFELNEHNNVQSIIFLIISLVGAIFAFILLVPLAEILFKEYLLGEIVYNGTKVPYLMDSNSLKETSYYTAWAVDVYNNTAQEARYWFNPLLSLVIPSLIIGVVIAFLISSILPRNVGYIAQKIEREVAGLLDEITLLSYGFHSDEERNKIMKQLLNADLRDLHDLERDWRMSIEDLKVLNKALIWRNRGFLYKLININDGIRVYLRFYFTLKYANPILGSVYIGAACLIIIIGLRGLKFIPSNEPSLVIFALGLEFTLLLIYALTLMYQKTDSEMDSVKESRAKDVLLSTDLGNSKEVEKLLKAFVRSTEKK